MVYIEAIRRSINKSIELIDSITDNTQFEENREALFDSIVAVIHLVGDIYPRIKKCDIWNTRKEERSFSWHLFI